MNQAHRSDGVPTPRQHGTPLPPGGDINFATLNCNGVMTQIEEGTKTVYRIQTILKYFKQTNVQLLALQEPHVSRDMEGSEFQRHVQKISKLAKGVGYNFLTQLTTRGMWGGGGGGGGGGVAVFRTQHWTHISSSSLSQRILAVNLQNEDGPRITVL